MELVERVPDSPRTQIMVVAIGGEPAGELLAGGEVLVGDWEIVEYGNVGRSARHVP